MVFLSPQVDLVFKKLFGSPANKLILIDFLNCILGRQEGALISDVTYSDTNNQLKLLEQKLSIVDVRCIDQNKNSYIVEMQIKNQYDFVERAQYYGACGLDIQLQPAESYAKLVPVIFVGIVNFTLFDRHNRYLTHHYIADQNDRERDLRLMEYHFIELPKFTKKLDQLDSLVDKWIYFLKEAHAEAEVPASFGKEPSLKTAFHVLEQCGWTREELYVYNRQIDTARVEASVLKTAIMTGRTEGLSLAARNMLKEGMSPDSIAKITGLSVDAILKLKDG